MNKAISESWHFMISNLKVLFLFAFPFITLSLIFTIIIIASSSTGKFHIFVNFCIYPFYVGGLLILISNISNNNNKVTFKALLFQIAPLWLPIIIVSLLSGIIVGLGFMALIIPGVWLLTRIFLSQLYVIFNDQSALEAMGTAFKTSKPYFWKMLSALLPIFILMIVLGYLNSYLSNYVNQYFIVPFQLIQEFIFIFLSVLQFRLYTLYGTPLEK